MPRLREPGAAGSPKLTLVNSVLEEACAIADQKHPSKKTADASPPPPPPPTGGKPERADKLLESVNAFLGRFVIYPSKHAHIAHTLWIAHTHCWTPGSQRHASPSCLPSQHQGSPGRSKSPSY